jgi:hypothetical protein
MKCVSGESLNPMRTVAKVAGGVRRGEASRRRLDLLTERWTRNLGLTPPYEPKGLHDTSI